jgi:hypothetical protein
MMYANNIPNNTVLLTAVAEYAALLISEIIKASSIKKSNSMPAKKVVLNERYRSLYITGLPEASSALGALLKRRSIMVRSLI